jgi:hypothetical protein
MAKKRRRTKSTTEVKLQSRGPRFLIPGTLLLAVLIGFATWYFLPRSSPLSEAAPYHGGARLAVDKELIDFGTVRFERMVDASFHLRNVGDQPLRLAVNKQVEAVQGC